MDALSLGAGYTWIRNAYRPHAPTCVALDKAGARAAVAGQHGPVQGGQWGASLPVQRAAVEGMVAWQRGDFVHKLCIHETSLTLKGAGFVIKVTDMLSIRIRGGLYCTA